MKSRSTTRLWVPVKSDPVKQVLIEVPDNPDKVDPHYTSTMPRGSKSKPRTGFWPELTELQDTLVAGVFWEKILTGELAPTSGQVSGQIKKILVQKLAGHITLKNFHRLMEQVDDLVPQFLRACSLTQDSRPRPSPTRRLSSPLKTRPEPDQKAGADAAPAPEARPSGKSLLPPPEIGAPARYRGLEGESPKIFFNFG